MTLKSLLKKFFLGGEVMDRVYSPVNGEIAVVEDLLGHREIRIGGVTQSGGLVERLWKIGITAISNKQSLILRNKQLAISNCLILGLGCGDVARFINKIWPAAKIIGVEIDPIVVEIGKKYFGLGEIKNLKIIVSDAFEYVENPNHQSLVTKYDLILVDLYLGQEFPKTAESEEFLNGLKNILADGGMIVFNRLYYNKEHRRKTEKFLVRVKSFFPEAKTKKIVTNILILASF